jgi:tRNA/tmRNA/rRNA uracil-C5-methylase (TrmA/RlmC/RlmD family)
VTDRGQARVQVTIERLVRGGLGLARLPGGESVLVAGGLPGELVEVAPGRRQGTLRGPALRVITRSPDRRSPPCPVADRCGGCDLMHAADGAQPALLAGIVMDAFRHLGRREIAVAPALMAGPALGYRTVVRLAVSPRGRLGYRAARSHRVVEIETCPVAVDPINRVIPRLHGLPPERVGEVTLRASLHEESVVAAFDGDDPPEPEELAGLVARAGLAGAVSRRTVTGRRDRGVSRPARDPARRRSDRLPSSESPQPPAGRRLTTVAEHGETSLWERYGDHLVRVSATSFAQVNPAVTGELYRAAARAAAATPGIAWELYGGSAGLACHLAPGRDLVEVVDNDPDAVVNGRETVNRAGLDGIIRSHVHDAAEAWRHADPAVIVVDPPRAGLSEEVTLTIQSSRASRLVYVSCDPATLARDTRRLEALGWSLESALAFAMFPQTAHVETLATLTR